MFKYFPSQCIYRIKMDYHFPWYTITIQTFRNTTAID